VKGSRTLLLHIACNDERGQFAGEAEAVQVQGQGWSLDLDGWARSFRVDDARLRLFVHGAWFPFMSSREWVGNWCWNAYRMKRPQALRLIAHLRWHGWHCDGGGARVCGWFDRLPAPPPRATTPPPLSVGPSHPVVDHRVQLNLLEPRA